MNRRSILAFGRDGNSISIRHLAATVLLVLCALYAVVVNPSKLDFGTAGRGIPAVLFLMYTEMGDVGTAQALAGLAAAYIIFSQRRHNGRLSTVALIAATLIASFVLVGMSFSAFDDGRFIAGRLAQVPVAAVTLVGLIAMLYPLVLWLFCAIDNTRNDANAENGAKHLLSVRRGMGGISTDLFRVAAFLFVVWTLLALPYFPGSVPHDGRYMLNQVYGHTELNTHHTLYATLVMGWTYRIGRKLFGIAGGCLLFTVLERLVGSIVFGRVVLRVKDMVERPVAWRITLCFYALAPMWWTYFQTLDKTALSFVAFTQYALSYTILVTDTDSRGREHAIMVFAGILTCLFRNDGIFVVLPTLAVFPFLMGRDRRRRMTTVCIMTAVTCVLLRFIVPPVLGLRGANQVESLSIPLQQIACAVTNHQEEISKDEAAAIEGVVQYEGIPERYTPGYSDPIKNHYRRASEADWKRFWKAYLSLLVRYPADYATAAVNQFYGYFDPFYVNNVMGRYQLYNKEALGESDADVTYSIYFFDEPARSLTHQVVEMVTNAPLISFLVIPGACTCVYVLLVMYNVGKRRRRIALCFLGPFLWILICCASPVNGFLRYALPQLAALPVFIQLTLSEA